MATITTKPRLTLAHIEREYATEGACKALLKQLRWPDGKVACPRCNDTKRVYRAGEDFRWKCKSCNKNGYRFTVLTGSVFENTNVPLRTWFRVAFLMVSSKKGMSALQIHRMIPPVRGEKGSYKTAWYMCHRLRAAMKDADFLAGVVEMDETFIGGKWKNRHDRGTLGGKRKKRGGTEGKTPVIGAIARKGNIVCQVIENTSMDTIGTFVEKVISDKVTLVATDEASAYQEMDWPVPHGAVTHSKREYVRGQIHTQNLDSFWSLLKRGIVGTFHKVSKDHLPLYLNEFAWRHNHRHDEDIFHSVLAGC